MKILLVSGKCLPSTDSDKYCEFLKDLVDTDIFKINKNKLAYIFPSDTSEISIKDDRLINFAIKSVGDTSMQIPNLSPMAINDIYNFFIDFKADIVISFDEGFLGLLSQVWAIQKKVPYIYCNTNTNEEFKTKTSRFFRSIFKNTGLSDEFYSNFYHNCTAIFVFKDSNSQKLQDLSYKGTIMLIDENLSKEEYQQLIFAKFKSLISSQPKYIKSNIFRKIVNRFSFTPFSSQENIKNDKKSLNIGTLIFAGGAVLTSIIAFATWKNFNKIKEKISKKDTTN
jgi:hypothetical protein